MRRAATVSITTLGALLGLCSVVHGQPRLPKEVKGLPKPTIVPAPTDASTPAGARTAANKLYAGAYRLYRAGRYHKAIRGFTAAITRDPNHSRARYALASALVLTGKPALGLALLAQLKRAYCDHCWAASDAAWRSLWRTPIFNQVIGLEKSDGNAEPHGWFRHGDARACPHGTRRAGDTMSRADFSPTGTAWCVNRRGQKHGPYLRRKRLRHGYDVTIGEYRTGIRVGFWRQIYGQFHEATSYYRDGKLHGTYSLSGTHRATHIDYRYGRKHGVEEHYRSVAVGDTYTQRRTDETHFVRGERHGLARTWDDDGKLTSTGVYVRGKRHGTFKEFADGRPTAVLNYRNGVPHGEFTYWDTTGKLLAKTTIRLGTGKWIRYEAGRLAARGQLVRGKKHGVWSESRANGSLHRGRYRYGVRVGVWHEQDDQSTAVGRYRNGRRHGKWRRGSAQHNRWIGAYHHGRKHGVWKYWDENGVVSAEGRYLHGLPDGKWTVVSRQTEGPQVTVWSRGRLLTVDGRKATKQQRRAQSSFARAPTDVNPLADQPQ